MAMVASDPVDAFHDGFHGIVVALPGYIVPPQPCRWKTRIWVVAWRASYTAIEKSTAGSLSRPNRMSWVPRSVLSAALSAMWPFNLA